MDTAGFVEPLLTLTSGVALVVAGRAAQHKFGRDRVADFALGGNMVVVEEFGAPDERDPATPTHVLDCLSMTATSPTLTRWEAFGVDADRGTSSIAQGPSAHPCLVEAEEFDGPAPAAHAYDYPEFGERDMALVRDSALAAERYEMFGVDLDDVTDEQYKKLESGMKDQSRSLLKAWNHLKVVAGTSAAELVSRHHDVNDVLDDMY